MARSFRTLRSTLEPFFAEGYEGHPHFEAGGLPPEALAKGGGDGGIRTRLTPKPTKTYG